MFTKVGAKLIALLLLGMLAASACTQTYSQAPLATPTLISTGLFVSPFPSGQDPLQIVAELGTQTAMAKTAAAGGSEGTPAGTGTAAVSSTPAPGESTATPTLGSFVTSAATTPAAVTVVPATSTSGSAVTPLSATSSVARPASYTLQAGEFPYCIARRFNLNPDDLLAANGLTPADATYLPPGRTLNIPQTGSFPGDRWLHVHPDTYTVDTPGMTIYGVACYYGDVLPQDIASANGLSLSSSLTLGQQLTIP